MKLDLINMKLAEDFVACLGDFDKLSDYDQAMIEHYRRAGEYGQVGTSALCIALNNGIVPSVELLQKALNSWGYEEMGALYDDFAAAWL